MQPSSHFAHVADNNAALPLWISIAKYDNPAQWLVRWSVGHSVTPAVSLILFELFLLMRSRIFIWGCVCHSLSVKVQLARWGNHSFRWLHLKSTSCKLLDIETGYLYKCLTNTSRITRASTSELRGHPHFRSYETCSFLRASFITLTHANSTPENRKTMMTKRSLFIVIANGVFGMTFFQQIKPWIGAFERFVKEPCRKSSSSMAREKLEVW